MRWTTFRPAGGGAERVGVLVGDQIHAIEPGIGLVDLLGDDGERLAAAGERAQADPVDVVPLRAARLLAPLPRPPSIRDFFAFEGHVVTSRKALGHEMDPDWYELPVFYFSNPAAVVGPDEPVGLPPGCAQFDYELEVAAVVGREGSDLDPDEAEDHIAGFLILNDWSARDLQQREMRQLLGPAKGKDSATGLGPVLVTVDELRPRRKGRAYDLAMKASVNGRLYSQGNLADIYWSFGELIAYASRGTRVVPGDVIGSGTCGTGCIFELSLTHGSEAYPWLVPGDEVVLEVDQLGQLRNRVREGASAIPLRRSVEARPPRP